MVRLLRYTEDNTTVCFEYYIYLQYKNTHTGVMVRCVQTVLFSAYSDYCMYKL